MRYNSKALYQFIENETISVFQCYDMDCIMHIVREIGHFQLFSFIAIFPVYRKLENIRIHTCNYFVIRRYCMQNREIVSCLPPFSVSSKYFG